MSNILEGVAKFAVDWGIGVAQIGRPKLEPSLASDFDVNQCVAHSNAKNDKGRKQTLV